MKKSPLLVCIISILVGFLPELGSTKPLHTKSATQVAAPRPMRVGECEISRIIWIHRGPMSAPGVYFRLANGVAGSAYIPEPVALRSREGDQVQTCLLYPANRCEGHDYTQIQSGRTFRTTNLRTREHWDASEYNRMCS